MKKYSIIIPVFNRPDEIEELLESLSKQSNKDFEVLIIEDGSTEKCDVVVDKYNDVIDIQYYYKTNSGPGRSRNFGMDKAQGEYMVIFDSDCVIPPQYIETVDDYLRENPLDTYGGPDSAHDSFSDVQKAINYAMTSFFTTGGIRGRKKQMDKFQPRSFNMGIKKEVYQEIGGFGAIHPGEDPDLSYRIMNAGYTTGLISDAYVYHKRRIDFGKFIKQVFKFGVVRVILCKWHPGTFKPVYALPSLFLLGALMLIALSLLVHPVIISPIVFLVMLLFFESLIKTKSVKIAILSILAAFIQFFSYGYGFLKSFFYLYVLRKDEKKIFNNFFFK